MNNRKNHAPAREDMAEKPQGLPRIAPMVDIYESEEEILLYADMPGVLRDDVALHVDNGKLEICSTRHLQNRGSGNCQEFGDVEYYRVFSVPQSIEVDKIRAELNDGVLTLHLPKARAAQATTITISES